MNKKSIIILVLSIVFVIFAGVFYFYVSNMTMDNSTISSLNENKQVEELELESVEEEETNTKDIEDVTYIDFSFENSEGKLIKISESKDKPVMILFWSPDNEDSVEMLKRVDSMNEKYSNIDFYMINILEETPKEIQNEITIDIYYDKLKEGTSKFNITEIPSMVYIQDNNEVLHAKSGLASTDALEANLDIISENF